MRRRNMIHKATIPYIKAIYKNIYSTAQDIDILGSYFDSSQINSIYINGQQSRTTVTVPAGQSIEVIIIPYKLTSCASMFSNCTELISVDFSNYDMSSVTNTSMMFNMCTSLEKIEWGIYKISTKDASWMFSCCMEIEKFDLSNIDFSNCTDVSYMFYMCAACQEIYLYSTIRRGADSDGMFEWTNGISVYCYNDAGDIWTGVLQEYITDGTINYYHFG